MILVLLSLTHTTTSQPGSLKEKCCADNAAFSIDPSKRDFLSDAIRTDQNHGSKAIEGFQNVFNETKVTADDGNQLDYFGYSVSISGDTAIVGAWEARVGSNQQQGVAYILVRNGRGWVQQAKLQASDGTEQDRFGVSVSIDGNIAVVGAWLGGTGTMRQGAAYIYVRNGTVWTEQAKLLAPDGNFQDEFGRSVSISGETVIIGAHRKTVGSNYRQGAAYVFVRNGTNWNWQATLTSSDGAEIDFFGWSVGISGDTAVIGAYNDDLANTNAHEGSAYIFVRSGTVWTEQAKLFAPDAADRDLFGHSVSISGETAIVGAYHHANGGIIDQGSVEVFVRSGTVWTHQAQLLPSDGSHFDRFGFSVALSGDTAVIGAVGKNAAKGAGYVFSRSGTVWSQESAFAASDGVMLSQFGHSVAISGATVIAGSWADIGGRYRQGAAHVYTFGPHGGIVSVGGKALSSNRIAIPNAFVTLTAQSGAVYTARTNQFGFYRFYGLTPGETAVITLNSKQFQFTPLNVTLNSNVTGLNLFANPLQ